MGRTHARGVESTAAVFHHPLHPMTIAFPVATLMAAPLADLAARASDDPFWRRAARWLLLGGLVSGAAASAVGLVDYVAIKQVRRLPSGGFQPGAARPARPGGPGRDRPGALDRGRRSPRRHRLAGGELSYRHGVGVIAEDSPTASEDLARFAGAVA